MVFIFFYINKIKRSHLCIGWLGNGLSGLTPALSTALFHCKDIFSMAKKVRCYPVTQTILEKN